MSALRFLMLSLVALAAGVAAEARGQAPEVTRATIEVLEELANEGVVDALYQLADLAAGEDAEAYFEAGDGFRYLALSAASGRASAVRWLAYRLALESDAATEAAVLLSASALMGDAQAVNDIRLWPLLGPVDERQMLRSFRIALDRLAQGRLMDCERLPFACPDNLAAVTALDASTVLRAGAWRNRPPAEDIEQVVAGFGPDLAAYVAFPESRYRRFLAEQRSDNRPVRERLARSGAAARDADWETRAYLDRQRMRDDSASSYLRSTRSGDLRNYADVLDAALGAVNRHRTASDAIEPGTMRRQQGGQR